MNIAAGKILSQHNAVIYDQVKLRMRLSLENLKLDGDLMYLCSWPAIRDRLTGMAMERLGRI